MTTEEFSNGFDTLLQSHLQESFGILDRHSLNEYEKSVFLTTALLLLIKEYFTKSNNKTQEGFDDTIKKQYDFSSLMKTSLLYNISHHWNNKNTLVLDTFNLDGIPFLLPEDYFLSINELVIDENDTKYSVIPLSYALYLLVLTKPYPYPSKRLAWRIIANQRELNEGNALIEYKSNIGTSKAKVVCKTAFASDNKSLEFILKYDLNLLNNLDEAKTILDTEHNLILLNLISNSELGSIDGILHIERTENYHNLELITCTFLHYEELAKVKLWDDDYTEKYQYLTITDIDGESKECIYQDAGAAAIAEIKVIGEASILGLLKNYMLVVYEKADEKVGKDPYSLFTIINFVHWEEGVKKNGRWLVWNGGWEFKGFGGIKFNPPADKIIKITNTSNQKFKVSFFNESGKSKHDYKIISSETGESIEVSIFTESMVPSKTKSISLTDEKQGLDNFDYIAIKNCRTSLSYPNIKFNILDSSNNVIKTVSTFTPEKDFGDDVKGSSAASRIGAVNVRHWDFADLFEWPQRIKIKDLTSFDSTDLEATIFDIKMSPRKIPTCEIIADLDSIKSYMMRYIRIPNPIVLENLEDLSIQGYSIKTECELPQECHQEILERAVTLAEKALRQLSVESIVNDSTINTK